MSVEDLEKFALRPAPRDVTIQCRVTRDRRGMEKGIYPTYYLHMEKEDGKRVSTCAKVFLITVHTDFLVNILCCFLQHVCISIKA